MKKQCFRTMEIVPATVMLAPNFFASRTDSLTSAVTGNKHEAVDL
jgi:hypothetical protein